MAQYVTLPKDSIESLSTGSLIDLLGENWIQHINAKRKWNWIVDPGAKSLRKALLEALQEKHETENYHKG